MQIAFVRRLRWICLVALAWPRSRAAATRRSIARRHAGGGNRSGGTLGTWSGRGDRQTDSFDVATGALRLRWEAPAAPRRAGCG